MGAARTSCTRRKSTTSVHGPAQHPHHARDIARRHAPKSWLSSATNIVVMQVSHLANYFPSAAASSSHSAKRNLRRPSIFEASVWTASCIDELKRASRTSYTVGWGDAHAIKPCHTEHAHHGLGLSSNHLTPVEAHDRKGDNR